MLLLWAGLTSCTVHCCSDWLHSSTQEALEQSSSWTVTLSHSAKTTQTSHSMEGEHLRVSWSVWYPNVSNKSFGPWVMLSFWIRLAFHECHQIPSDWCLGSSEAGWTPLIYCHVLRAHPKKFLQTPLLSCCGMMLLPYMTALQQC